ncbi:MAG: homoserine O-succinyltransferase [Treponema sp.]|jgi:homoserine O-succinyltransferase|nr:homoserine O-succinyltransferase [Treponema sp.]
MAYDPLDREYRRDISKGLPIATPRNYYPDDNPAKTPVVRAHLFFSNWLCTRRPPLYYSSPYAREEDSPRITRINADFRIEQFQSRC